MAKNGKEKLSYQKDKGFKKSIGTSKIVKGKPIYKMWWLGPDERKAQELAQYIKAQWTLLKASGSPVWTKVVENKITAYKSSLYSAEVTKEYKTVDASSTLKRSNDVHTYFQAIEYYCDIYIPSTNVGEQWKRDLAIRMQYLKDALDDVPLSMIDSEQLIKIVNYYSSILVS